MAVQERADDARFDELQAKLAPLWRSLQHLSTDEQTIVVVPSLSIDITVPPGMLQAYEERFLFLLLLLRQPRARLVYVTSEPIAPAIVDYYLGLLPGVIASHARPRLFLVSPVDGGPMPLTRKLLDRPRLLEQIRGLIPDRDRAHLVPYNTTEIERELALALGIPMYAADPKFFWYGTKSGCRAVFSEEGVRHPLGLEDLRSIDDVVRALATLRARQADLRSVLVKLNEGVSGQGNALVDLAGLPEPGASGERAALRAAIESMSFEVGGMTLVEYERRLAQEGGIVEERITGAHVRSPSVQLRITPLGQVEVLSTHDQLLGGPTGQTYVGCRFPADPGYASTITIEAEKVGRRLAREGVLGRFAIDFLVVSGDGRTWDPYAIEINLRKGGTTHPFLTLQFLTDGFYDPDDGVFRSPLGHEKAFVATDHVELPALRGLTPDDLFDIAVRHRLHFDHGTQTGVVFHMMSAMSQCGIVGLTAVENSGENAHALYERAVAILGEEAEGAFAGT